MRTSATGSRLPFEAEDALGTLARRIRAARIARGLTQPDLAAMAGISTNTIVAMEKGRGSVQLGYWLKVLWALDLLTGLHDAIARLGHEAADVALLEGHLPLRVHAGRR